MKGLMVEDCSVCIFNREYPNKRVKCGHPRFDGYDIDCWIKDPNSIPKWCPLDDIEEDKPLLMCKYLIGSIVAGDLAGIFMQAQKDLGGETKVVCPIHELHEALNEEKYKYVLE